MYIKNVKGTSDRSCYCGSWYNHWSKFSGQYSAYCQVNGCINKNPVGAHVKHAYGNDNRIYIYPLCNEHNKSEEILEVSDSYKMVSSNVSETCGK